MSKSFDLIHALEPLLLEPKLHSPDLGSGIITAARSSSYGNLLLITNYNDAPVTEAIDLSQYNPYGDSGTLYRLNTTSLTTSSISGTSTTLTMLGGETLAFTFPPPHAPVTPPTSPPASSPSVSSGGGGGGTSGNTTGNQKLVGTTTPLIATSSLFPKYQFTRTLKQGMTGEDVRQLQKYLNTHGFPVALKGVGSLGNESKTFGKATLKALKNFQEAHAKEILTPVGLTKGTGIYGPATQKFINTLISH